MDKTKLLIVEDDPNLGQILTEYLGIKGYDAYLCEDGESGYHAFKTKNFDLCILDVMMPKKDGFTLAEEIRETNSDIPLIFLTAKSMKEDAIQGLKIGADDYVTKPFSMEELLLRIKAVLRRVQNGEMAFDGSFSHCKMGVFDFEYDKQLLVSEGKSVKLTTKEAELLKLLCMNKNKTLQRSTALKEVWGDDSYFNARSMDVYIAKLRKLLKEDESIQILTVHGEGFKLLATE